MGEKSKAILTKKEGVYEYKNHRQLKELGGGEVSERDHFLSRDQSNA